MDASDNTLTSAEIKQSDTTQAEATAKCDRCERRKIRERGYAREARLRKKALAEKEKDEEEPEKAD
jgi:hypothetical protein